MVDGVTLQGAEVRRLAQIARAGVQVIAPRIGADRAPASGVGGSRCEVSQGSVRPDRVDGDIVKGDLIQRIQELSRAIDGECFRRVGGGRIVDASDSLASSRVLPRGAADLDQVSAVGVDAVSVENTRDSVRGVKMCTREIQQVYRVGAAASVVIHCPGRSRHGCKRTGNRVNLENIEEAAAIGDVEIIAARIDRKSLWAGLGGVRGARSLLQGAVALYLEHGHAIARGVFRARGEDELPARMDRHGRYRALHWIW